MAEQLLVLHPGVDDAVAHPISGEEVQIESFAGELPFLIEASHEPAEYVNSVDAATVAAARRLGFRVDTT